MKKVWWYIWPFRHNSGVWRTDKQTDRQTDGRTDKWTDKIAVACNTFAYNTFIANEEIYTLKDAVSCERISVLWLMTGYINDSTQSVTGSWLITSQHGDRSRTTPVSAYVSCWRHQAVDVRSLVCAEPARLSSRAQHGHPGGNEYDVSGSYVAAPSR